MSSQTPTKTRASAHAAPQPLQAPSRKKFWLLRSMVAALFMVGAGSLLYSPAAQWMTQRDESRVAETLSASVSAAPRVELDTKLAQAHAYNEDLARGATLEGYDYFSMVSLYPKEALARLRIPSINLDQTVHHTMSEAVLQTGLGHMEGTSLPVGGVNTNAVIGGHRGLATAVGLTFLNKVSVGDEILIESLGQNLKYQVISTEVLTPGEADMQPVQAGRDLVTLVTCTPIGLNTERIVVVAERVLPGLPDGSISSASDLPGFPWWALGMGAATLISTLYLTYPLYHAKLRRLTPWRNQQ